MISDTLIYCSEDNELNKLAEEESECKLIPYSTLKHKIKNGITSVENTELLIFGNHNLQNMNFTLLVCKELGVSKKDFIEQISTFKGASKRLELIKRNKNSAIYKDFAHSPSKLKSHFYPMKNQFKKRKLIACMELHTFSSLKKEFLNNYYGTMDSPNSAIIYFSQKSIIHKN